MEERPDQTYDSNASTEKGNVLNDTLSMPDFRSAKYQTAEMIRRNMGEVLRVKDKWIGRDVVMKMPLEQRDLAQFIREAQVTAKLEHPNIVPVHELGIDP